MLQKVMLKVKAAEAKMESIVKESERQRQEMIENAKLKAKQLVEVATEDATSKAAALLADVKSQVEIEKEHYASALHQELEQSKQVALTKKPEAVAAIIEGIV